jgi:hypothetical protein
MAVVGTSASFSADEGAAIVQARSLARGDGWIVPHPVPEVDPTGAAYPLELSGRGPNGTAPFAKHPLYAVLLAGADRIGGIAGMVLLSVLGTVAAAGLAALLARRLDPALARPTVWVVGLASPLLFDGYLVIAHTLGAACAVGAVLAATVAFERRRRWPAAALAVLPCVGAAVLLRTEAAFLGVGLAVAALTLVFRRRDRLVAVLVAGASLAGVVVARLVEHVWIGHVLGGPSVGTGAVAPAVSSGFVADRWQAFVLTWLRPSYGAAPQVDLCLVLMAAALVVGAYAIRRGRPGVAGAAGTAAVAGLVALFLASDNVVPGLLVACPVVAAGLALVGRRTLASAPARLAAVTSLVFAGAVLVTQYSSGGSGEWGGRYFALALPVALPVLVLAIRQRGSAPFVAGLLVCSVAMSLMAMGSLRSTHRFTAGLVAAVDRVAGPDRPVLVTTAPLVPRLAWPTFDHQRWLLSKPDDLAAVVGRMAPAGITRFTFVTRGDADVVLLPASAVRETSASYNGWQILVFRTA